VERRTHLASEFEEFLDARLADSGGAARDQSHLASQIHFALAASRVEIGIHAANDVQQSLAAINSSGRVARSHTLATKCRKKIAIRETGVGRWGS